jgi:ubiquitin-protein ligase
MCAETAFNVAHTVQIKFDTKVYHPSVMQASGEVCQDLLNTVRDEMFGLLH